MKNKNASTCIFVSCALALMVGLLISGCAAQPTAVSAVSKPKLADELVVYNWVQDMPDEVMDSFTQEYGVKIKIETYESQEEAIENIKSGKVYDVVNIDNRLIQPLIDEKIIAPIDLKNIPNFQELSESFHHRPYDPQNAYSVPYTYGTVGIIVNTARTVGKVTSWKDLWKQKGAGKVALWRGSPRESFGIALKMLGYSVNTEDRGQLEQALAKLMEIRDNVFFAEDYGDGETIAPLLEKGYVVMGMGWANDYFTSQESMDGIEYVLPEEGTMIWGDNFVIPANSTRKATAEAFINYLLRPEVSATITNAKHYATPNLASHKFVDPALLASQVVFPLDKDLNKGEMILAVSPEAEQMYQELWDKFLNAP